MKTLRTLGVKKLVTLNSFVCRKGITLEDVRRYNNELAGRPKRTDFIPYDDEGNKILNHTPLFKGWVVCQETSSTLHKVAKLSTVGSDFRIYFGTANGVTVVSQSHMADECTYNDLALFFEGNLELEKLKIVPKR